MSFLQDLFDQANVFDRGISFNNKSVQPRQRPQQKIRGIGELLQANPKNNLSRFTFTTPDQDMGKHYYPSILKDMSFNNGPVYGFGPPAVNMPTFNQGREILYEDGSSEFAPPDYDNNRLTIPHFTEMRELLKRPRST